jgi:hypothetical protein
MQSLTVWSGKDIVVGNYQSTPRNVPEELTLPVLNSSAIRFESGWREIFLTDRFTFAALSSG